MRTNKLTALMLAGLLAAGLTASTSQAAKKKKAPKGPVVVGTDAEGDWGSNADPTVSPLGDATGQDLVKGEIEATGDNINFIATVTGLPPSGGVPEFVRYVWTVTVDGEMIQLDGKFTNYTRGACDPTAGTCPPPRDPGSAPFLVRGNCTSNQGTAVTCEEIGLVNGTFDGGAGTISVEVPREMLGAKPGSKIAHGSQPDSGFQGIWTIPSAFVSQGQMPLDELILTKVFTVPGK